MYGWHYCNSESFQSGLDEFNSYLKGLAGKESSFDAAHLNDIIASFAPTLCDHLKSEILTLLALSKYGNRLPIEELWDKEGKHTVVIPESWILKVLLADVARLQWQNSTDFHSSSSISMLLMKIICGRIGRLFLFPRDGPSLIVSHCATKDTGSLPAVTEVESRSPCTHKVHASELIRAFYGFPNGTKRILIHITGTWEFDIAL